MRHFYSAIPLWEGAGKRDHTRAHGHCSLLLFYDECREPRSGKHYVCPAHTTPMAAQGLRLIREALEWAVTKPHTLLAIFGTPSPSP